MLAEQICKLFSEDELCNLISKEARKEARLRHNPVFNAKRLLEIYKNV